ncbi:hypothetical protein CENDO_00400 [Corynebacterium endometrii]|uniref:Uncharacterized protein n=1 Tax=Corynebacterium endometrii TaxID=2488819 RepID=A0A4P7QDP6_9CORY|nr:hypothetical protein CENDO_00400 [Corynebacterium endometrii]
MVDLVAEQFLMRVQADVGYVEGRPRQKERSLERPMVLGVVSR